MNARVKSSAEPQPTQRLDKWLWFARLVKTRTMAAALVADGKVRVNRLRIVKPGHAVRGGDVVTVAVAGRVRVLKISAPGMRRGPASEAAGLYEDLTAGSPGPGAHGAQASGKDPAAEGSGRPTKKERRLLRQLTGKD
jgi:ribosome-associated heat shock protein Hsp15